MGGVKEIILELKTPEVDPERRARLSQAFDELSESWAAAAQSFVPLAEQTCRIAELLSDLPRSPNLADRSCTCCGSPQVLLGVGLGCFCRPCAEVLACGLKEHDDGAASTAPPG